ncbi:hypothetical protein ACE1MR_11725 [Lysinibacillus sp. fkY65-2]
MLMSTQSKLTLDHLEMMSIGMVLDHIQLYADMINPDESNKGGQAKKATQADINALKI